MDLCSMKMYKILIVFVLVIYIQQCSCQNFLLCDESTMIEKDCSAQIWTDNKSPDDTASFTAKYVLHNSSECEDSFSRIPAISSSRLGQISIEPFVLYVRCLTSDPYYHVVPNIVFRDIKWNQLKLRVEQRETYPTKRHCGNLEKSDNVTIYEHPVVHYDCILSLIDGSLRNTPTHVLDVEATDGSSVDGWQFLFYIPSTQMLSPNTSETAWKPFVYVENFVSSLRLRIVRHPPNLNITSYRIEVMKACVDCSNDAVMENVTVRTLNGSMKEQTHDYTPTSSGTYYFIVTALHDKCMSGYVQCQMVKSPQVHIAVMLYLYFIILGLAIAASLLVFIIYRWYTKRTLSEIPKPPKVLVIYPSGNGIHAECVASFVDYLRSECGFDVLYDGDVPKTSHCDPYFWAEDAVRNASHILYVVGPMENKTDTKLRSIFHGSALHDVDKLLLSFLKAVRALHDKNVMNVFFEHSDGHVPAETRNDREFHLLRDWQKFIAFLSRDLLPKKQIMRTERGKCFINDLTRVKKMLVEE